jgi:hypothetical protein
MKTRLTPIRGGAAIAIALLLICFHSEAKPPIRDGFFLFYPSAVGTRLDTVPSHPTHCGVCHYNFSGGGTRNHYGAALESSGFNLNSDSGRSNAFWAMRPFDSDGDSFSNQTEITNTVQYSNTPTFPGLATSNTNLVSSVSLTEIQNYLTPAMGGDTTPPVVQLLSPNGGQVLTANRSTNIAWSAVDASGVAAVNLYLSLDNGTTYRPIALNIANSGTFNWFPANRPSTGARIKVEARDTYSNMASDASDSGFTVISPAFTNVHGVPTTLRDFDLPGTQPFEHGVDLEASANCASCHGGYDVATEPQHNWAGSMMAHASRDPLFLANFSIANQDAPESGDLCLRCHFARGWLAGRSVPTDGSRMTAADGDGVSCALCHRMVNPLYMAGAPAIDTSILAALSFSGTNSGNGMFVIDPADNRRGPFTNAAAPHAVLVSPFHRSAAFCGTCHDVSNPAFEADGLGYYNPNALDATATNFSPHFMAPVERTYSEWLNSEYNNVNGVFAPRFAGNKPDGRVSTCQDCHMRDVSGRGCNPTNSPPLRPNLPLHDLAGGTTWIASILTNLFPAEVNSAAIDAGIQRAQYMLSNAASIAVASNDGVFRVTVTNECGHKLPTGYPEGRRIWLNVRFYDDMMALIGESGAYNPTNGVLTVDLEAKVYEVHPGLATNLADALDLEAGPSFHFVLNNQIYSDNRIPPRGFTNASFSAFGGAPTGYSYSDGQYWDTTSYTMPSNTATAIVRLYYQSTSKEFVEFLRDENRTDSRGQELYDLWRTNGMCPPTLMAEAVWVPIFQLQQFGFAADNRFQVHFRSRPGVTYTIEFADELPPASGWHTFENNGSITATSTASFFEDDFTSNSSGGPPTSGARFYRFRFNGTP